jgi:alpha/beta superfamily hydrolase
LFYWIVLMIEPFFYGDRGALAFYHPSSDPAATRLMILCPPLFDEYRRTYKALSDLATACASNGVHVIRIDYSGTGEAQGMLSDVLDQEWVDDIYQAIEEGINLTGAESAILVGVRFGATLAAQVNHRAVSRYVFWDPVENGSTYRAWLDQLEQQSRESHIKLAKMMNKQPEDISYACFTLSDSLLRSLALLNTDSFLANHGDRTWVFTTNKELCEQGRYKNCEHTGYEYDWPPYHEGNLAPKPVLERIAQTVLMT